MPERFRVQMPVMATLLVVALAAPSALAARTNSSSEDFAAVPTNVDLSSALRSGGTFAGSHGLVGSVDMKEWSLVSDMAAGEAPRFAPRSTAAITPNAWSALGSNGAGGGAMNSLVYAVAVSGTDVYVGGAFYQPAGLPAAADFLAKWNGSSWSALAANQSGPSPINAPVRAILVDGSNVYVGGEFFNAGGDSAADAVAVWNGSTWSDVAGAAPGAPGAISGQVHALAKNGVNLYIGGFFNNSPAVASAAGDMVLHWDGSWHSLGAQFNGEGPIQCTVYALAATSTGVIAGGCFTNVYGDATIDYIAEYKISDFQWYPLDSFGGNGSLNATVRALTFSGSDLYVGGEFTTVDGLSGVNYLARWFGLGWAQVANPSPGNFVRSISVSGSNIYVGGDFINAGGNGAADYVAKWNSSSFAWSPLGSNGTGGGALGTIVNALGMTSNALVVGGNFQNAAQIPEADYVAAYGIGAVTNQKPDGRIKKGSGSLVGNNIYNTTGANQTRTGSAAVGGTITFTVSIQNDGSNAGKFKVAATASGNVNYEVKYFHGTTDITSAVVAGTYTTAKVGAGNAFAITAKVKVLPAATSGSSTTRLITITSAADAAKVDAVKLIGQRP